LHYLFLHATLFDAARASVIRPTAV